MIVLVTYLKNDRFSYLKNDRLFTSKMIVLVTSRVIIFHEIPSLVLYPHRENFEILAIILTVLAFFLTLQ